MYQCIYIYIYIYILIRSDTCSTYKHTYIYIYVYNMYIYIYIYIERDFFLSLYTYIYWYGWELHRTLQILGCNNVEGMSHARPKTNADVFSTFFLFVPMSHPTPSTKTKNSDTHFHQICWIFPAAAQNLIIANWVGNLPRVWVTAYRVQIHNTENSNVVPLNPSRVWVALYRATSHPSEGNTLHG